MSNFVTYTKQEFEDILTTVSIGWELVSGNEDTKCWEYVYEFPTSNLDVGVRIYSTVDKRTGHTRGKGEDAIRVVFWDIKNDRPIGKGKRILRVEGATSIGDRIEQRVTQFLTSVTKVSIVDFEYVRYVLQQDGGGFAYKLLTGLADFGSLTKGQLAYVLGDKSPKGWDTMEAKCKKANPNFVDDYANSLLAQADSDEPTADETNPVDEANYNNDLYRRGHHMEDNTAHVNRPKNTFATLSQPKDVFASEDTALKNLPGNTTVNAFGHYTVPSETDLAGTSLYPYWKYPFDNFNPVQTAVLQYRNNGNNLIIGANTSAGKTVCAELLMDEVLDRKTNNRVIYLSPLKSLTQEKYDDWQERYPNHEITILTGDYTLSEAMKNKLAASQIIVMTSEMADSRTRRMQSEKNYWLMEVGLVIVDESHIISTSRGHAVESGLMRFSRINHKARILFLSATMPNCEELASWLSLLNGKSTDVVYSTWRPVELDINFMGHKVITNGGGRPDYWGTQEAKRSMAVGIVQSKPEEKFLVFCHDKNTGRNMVSRFQKLGIDAHFHNADLDMKERLAIEQSFTRRTNGLRVLVSTSTLAWGRNLPARNVVIVGVHRGIQEVDELDIIQMAGRAGRYGIDDAGFVYLVCPQGSEASWEHTFKNPRPVTSVLNKPNILAFHVLAEIENKSIDSVNGLFTWYKRSLASMQDKKPYDKEDAGDLLETLKDMEMLEYKGNFVRPTITDLGKVSAWLYYSPYDVFDWYSNLNKLFGEGAKVPVTDKTLAWAIGDIKSNDWGYVPADMRTQAETWKWELRDYGIQASDAVVAGIAAHHCLTGAKIKKGTVIALMRAMVYDIRRVSQALGLIDKMYAKWEVKEVWDSLPQRIMYGISEEMVELTLVPGVGGVTARKLYERGIKNLYDLANAENFKTLIRITSPAKAKAFQEEAAKLL